MGLFGEGRHMSTVSALDSVEVVRIEAADFQKMLDSFPEIRDNLRGVARERAAQNLRKATAARDLPLDDFLTQGLMEAQSLLVLDLEKCTRCDQCVKACADAH